MKGTPPRSFDHPPILSHHRTGSLAIGTTGGASRTIGIAELAPAPDPKMFLTCDFS
jgi:hypothetical protein